MRKNKFLAALAIAACLATSVPFSVNAATPGQAKDASKVTYGTVSTANQAIIQKLFDATYYAKENPDLAKAGITTEAALFNHFVKFGIFEGRACCEGFNVAAYKSSYSDLQAAFGDDIVAYYVHYVTFGQTEKRALVTVEAATAAGVTVKSAADGTVVAAGAAKPAAGGAASSGSAASTENKTSVDADEDEENATVKTNETVAAKEVPSYSGSIVNKVEATYVANVDYDYATGNFYDYTSAESAEAKNIPYGTVKVGSKYYPLQNYTSLVDTDKFMSIAGYYDTTTPLQEITGETVDTDSTYSGWVEKKAYSGVAAGEKEGVDSKYWIKRGSKYYRVDVNNMRYKDVSGNWNLKNGYAAVLKDGWQWFFVEKANSVNTARINIVAEPYASKVDNSDKYVSRYHEDKDGHALADVEVNGAGVNGYVVDGLSAAASAGMVYVTARDGYLLSTPFNAKNVGTYEYNGYNGNVIAYHIVSMEEACKKSDDYEQEGGVWYNTTFTAPKEVTDANIHFNRDEFVFNYSDGKYYKKVDKTKTLLENCTWYGNYTEYKFLDGATHKQIGKVTTYNQAYRNSDAMTKSAALADYQVLTPDLNTSFVFDAYSGYYYKKTVAEYAFALPGTQIAKQQKVDGVTRFYAINK